MVFGTRRKPRVARWMALTVTAIELFLAILLFANYDVDAGGFQYQQQMSWIATFDIQYRLGADGLSVPLVLLNGLLGLTAVLISWDVSDRPHLYFACLLVLQAAVMGVFLALDLILFFVFWELELIPMFLLISMWGSGRREYSAMKFLLFTLLGSAFMLVAILALYLSFPPGLRTFDMTVLAERSMVDLIVPTSLVFWGFLIAFAVKLPIFPLHTWLPDAHTDAPTAVSVMLAGVLLKMGGYGLLRINAGLFTEELAALGPMLMVLGLINILYGAFIVLRQTDLKRMVAYSSVSHMGFVVVGLASVAAAGDKFNVAGLNGAALQLFSHGVITGLLFVVVGLIYDRAHTRHIPDFGGIAHQIPLISIGFMLAGLASLGLPTTSGFAAEIMIFLAAYSAFPWLTTLAAFGVVLASGYILWAAQRTLFGPRLARWDNLEDARLVDLTAMAVLIIPIFVVGVYPRILTDMFGNALAPILSRMGA